MTKPSDQYPYNKHPLQGPARASWTDRNVSLDALHVLEAALAEPAPSRHPEWAGRVRVGLEALRKALEVQASGDSEASSLLSEISVDEPRLLPRIKRLRRQHSELRDRAIAIVEELEAQADRDHLDVADIRDRVAELARRLRHHRAQEADLIYEAVNVNLGTGD